MPYVSLIEGQGIAGPVQNVSATTTTLLSCIGIIMYNRTTHVAGLYHYGANTIHQPATINALTLMIQDINPDDIFITAPPVRPIGWEPGSTLQDRNDVDLFMIATAPMGAVQWLADRRRANYVANGNAIQCNVQTTATEVDPGTIAWGPGAGGRQISGNLTFYT